MSSEWETKLLNSDWFFFHTAANVIAGRLGVSGGTAERTLRELCATGDVRSKQVVNYDNQGWRTEAIKPSEWSKDQMDIEWLRRDDVRAEMNHPSDPWDEDETYGPIGVYVNGDDFRYWLSKQPASQAPPPARPRRGKTPLIIDHLREMFPKQKFPHGIPDPADHPRKDLRADLLKKDKRLDPLDEGTLKSAIDEFNLLIRNDPI